MLAIFNQRTQHRIPGDNKLNSTIIWIQQAAVTAHSNICWSHKTKITSQCGQKNHQPLECPKADVLAMLKALVLFQRSLALSLLAEYCTALSQKGWVQSPLHCPLRLHDLAIKHSIKLNLFPTTLPLHTQYETHTCCCIWVCNLVTYIMGRTKAESHWE